MAYDADKRKHLRFKPDPLEVAHIAIGSADTFNPDFAALIVEESPLSGCSVGAKIWPWATFV